MTQKPRHEAALEAIRQNPRLDRLITRLFATEAAHELLEGVENAEAELSEDRLRTD